MSGVAMATALLCNLGAPEVRRRGGGGRWRRPSGTSCPLWRFMPRIRTRSRTARAGQRGAMEERPRVRAGRGPGQTAEPGGEVDPRGLSRLPLGQRGPARCRLHSPHGFLFPFSPQERKEAWSRLGTETTISPAWMGTRTGMKRRTMRTAGSR